MKGLLLCLFTVILFSCQDKKDARIESIDKFLRGQAEHFKFNGNVLVAEKGKVIYKKSFGLADFRTNDMLNDSSLFEVASVSKQFTAMSILLLKKQGKLNLNDSLRKFFPELPYHGITIHNLLTHTSGLPDYWSIMNSKWDHSKIAFNKDMIDLLAKEKPPINFRPGMKWEYSNTAYAILASIIEKVSGETYKDFLAANIFQPLNMQRSRVYNTRRSGEKINNYAYGFVWSSKQGKFVLPDSLPNYDFVYFLDGIQGDGIVNSTTEDLLKWNNALTAQTLLGDATSKEFSFPHVLCDTVLKNYYGYGVFVGKNQFGNFVRHSGGWPGYITELTRYTDDDRSIIILSNNESSSPLIEEGIANILSKNSIEQPYQHLPAKIDSSSLKPFIGSYSIKNLKFDIQQKGDTLLQVFKSGARRKYVPESDSKVYSVDGRDVQFEMVTGNQNDSKFYRILYGVKDEMTKLK